MLIHVSNIPLELVQLIRSDLAISVCRTIEPENGVDLALENEIFKIGLVGAD